MSTRAEVIERSRHSGSGHSARHAGVTHTAVEHHAARRHAETGSRGERSSGSREKAVSRAVAGPRLGEQLSELGVIQSYDAGSNTAGVQLLGAQADVVGPLAVNKAIDAGLLVAGAQCLVILMDSANPADGVVVSVW